MAKSRKEYDEYYDRPDKTDSWWRSLHPSVQVSIVTAVATVIVAIIGAIPTNSSGEPYKPVIEVIVGIFVGDDIENTDFHPSPTTTVQISTVIPETDNPYTPLPPTVPFATYTFQPTYTLLPTYTPLASNTPGSTHTESPSESPTAILVQNTRTPIVTLTISPVVLATSYCQQFAAGEIREVPAGTIAFGDLVVDDVRQYDLEPGEAVHGYPESTVAFFEAPGVIEAPYAAGCTMGNMDTVYYVAQEQIDRGCGGAGGSPGCQSVRIVIIDKNGNQSVEYYTRRQ